MSQTVWQLHNEAVFNIIGASLDKAAPYTEIASYYACFCTSLIFATTMRKITLFWFLTLWLDGSTGVPAVPTTILMFVLNSFSY